MKSLSHFSREAAPYASQYCEENTYKLIDILYTEHQLPDGDVFAVFISNPCKTTCMWLQRAGAEDRAEAMVVWDYHVITLVTIRDAASRESRWWVLDSDTLLPYPCPAQQYLMESFRPTVRLRDDYRPMFRVIPGRVYLAHFSSDRTHMAMSNVPPPPWPPIRGTHAASPMQLPLYWNMNSSDNGGDNESVRTIGTTMGISELMELVTLRGDTANALAR